MEPSNPVLNESPSRWPHYGPKTAPRRTPGVPQEAPSQPQEAPKRHPRCPQAATKRPPRGHRKTVEAL
eukprot:6519930-Pyramimonas_sp.AAC.1